MGELKKWLKQIGFVLVLMEALKVNGTSKDKKNPDRRLPSAKARSLSKAERASTARKKKKAGAKAKQWYQIQNQQKLEISKKEGQLSGLSGVKRWLARLLLGDAVQ